MPGAIAIEIFAFDAGNDPFSANQKPLSVCRMCAIFERDTEKQSTGQIPMRLTDSINKFHNTGIPEWAWSE